MILVGDDLLDREKAASETWKNKTNRWIDSSFSKMLDDDCMACSCISASAWRR